jgi:hypothetical protein
MQLSKKTLDLYHRYAGIYRSNFSFQRTLANRNTALLYRADV